MGKPVPIDLMEATNQRLREAMTEEMKTLKAAGFDMPEAAVAVFFAGVFAAGSVVQITNTVLGCYRMEAVERDGIDALRTSIRGEEAPERYDA